MKIVILISSALVDQETGKMAGLAETVECDDERGEFLVSIGAAKKADEPDEPEDDDDAEDDGDKEPEKAPAKKAAPAAKPAAKPVTK